MELNGNELSEKVGDEVAKEGTSDCAANEEDEASKGGEKGGDDDGKGISEDEEEVEARFEVRAVQITRTRRLNSIAHKCRTAI